MKLISFSIWGNNPKYTIGALKNADLASEIYPDWLCRFYVSFDVPRGIIYELEEKENVEVIEVNKLGDWTFSFNRFLPISEDNIDVVISRDADSRLNLREKLAVDEWLESDKGFHIMKDHPWHHSYPILAGMFGCKSKVIANISDKINSFSKSDWYHTDQEFLKTIIYPEIKNNVFVHDEFSGANPFPIERKGLEFVGKVYDENDVTVEEHLPPLANWIQR